MSRYNIVYLGHDNRIDLVLTANDEPVTLAGMSKMTLSFGTFLVSSTNLAGDPIRWQLAGWQTGEIRLSLGGQAIPPAKYLAPLVVYDATYTNGLVWGLVPIWVKADPEAQMVEDLKTIAVSEAAVEDVKS